MVLDDASPQGTTDTMGAPLPADSFVPPNPEFPIPKYHPAQVRPETVVRPDLFIMAFYPGPQAWRRKLTATINRRLLTIQAVAERPVRQEEVDAITQHASRKVYYERFGAPVGLAVTYWSVNRTLRTHETWRMYYREDGAWVKPVEGVKALMNMAKADSANAARIMGVVGMRGFFWTLAGLTLSNIVAAFTESVGMAVDPRLEDFRKQGTNQSTEAIQRKQKEAMMRELAEKRRGQVVGKEAVEEQAAPVETGWESQSSASRPQIQTQTQTQPIVEQPQGQSFFDDDDASPTAPEYRAAERKSQGGSAWERIRQQTMSGSPEQDQGSRGSWEEASSSGSSSGSSASSPDWSRQRERQQSQAEFDRLVEAERKAGADSWSGGKSW
ncbi:hypothetical protein P170DRAFT_440542 [Aspergillus steynii IBT 23096]|uniref:Uncharacterized protein n=1 Tax=Aspergillus steynii IBT 23096 TaxID=1392250 RepID=A0A2I2FUC6_9EURO|nr:uncharacterized protein P170DRAFT_440542 [Aspergillus steynii IBT 23096]PLB44224.1 hypothetical protein P170DRAFT_440542 [Aspergillus steynii IBT 23096]